MKSNYTKLFTGSQNYKHEISWENFVQVNLIACKQLDLLE